LNGESNGELKICETGIGKFGICIFGIVGKSGNSESGIGKFEIGALGIW